MSSEKNTKRFNAAHEVYERIVSALQSGVVIWKKPWVDGTIPMNVVTKRAYKGFNTFVLNMLCIERGYATGRFLTFEQCNRLGGKVRKGEKSARVFWRDFVHPAKRDESGVVLKDEAGRVVRDTEKVIFVDRHYSVFNIAQCEGLPSEFFVTTRFDTKPIASAERIVHEYKDGPIISHGGGVAYYSPIRDTVCLPDIENFKSSEGYYGTLFHELVHSTGASSRLERDMTGTFGTSPYAFEELVAEIGSSILCNECGLLPYVEDAATYCDSWLKCFVDGTIKKKQMLSAFSKAWSAVKFIRGGPSLNKRSNYQ